MCLCVFVNVSVCLYDVVCCVCNVLLWLCLVVCVFVLMCVFNV